MSFFFSSQTNSNNILMKEVATLVKKKQYPGFMKLLVMTQICQMEFMTINFKPAFLLKLRR